jgi:hypothetical protein
LAVESLTPRPELENSQGQEATYAPQQDWAYSITSSAMASRVGGTLRPSVLAVAAKHRLPAIYPTREFVENGGLMAYGVS